MIFFTLWREHRLSLAELVSVFPNAELIFADMEIAVFDKIDIYEAASRFKTLWWSIKTWIIISEVAWEKWFLTESIKELGNIASENQGKISFAISTQMKWTDIFTIWMKIKKELKRMWVTNIRLVNKWNANINAATFKNEKLFWDSWVEFNMISFGWDIYFWKTIAYQDVDEYAKRDMWKARDMNVWMLPPKLAQMMLNIWLWSKKPEKTVYDPFCWLWTVLIEAALMGVKKVIWSDISQDMVKAAKSNVSKLNSKIAWDFFELDAKKVWTTDYIKTKWLTIVTEWYLWKVMTKWHVTESGIEEEKRFLKSLYESFFMSLNKSQFSWNIVISFPFWQLRWKYQYFSEVYDIIKKNWFKTQKMLPAWIWVTETRSWSILYHRPGQQVWREIFLLSK